MQHLSALAARAAHPLRLPLLLLAALLLLLARPARAQVDRQPYVTNGTVSAIVRDGGTVYIGGSFTYVGPNNPNGTALDAGTGAPDLRSARPNGTVNAAVSDGAGGWYIGGVFTQVGGLVRNRIAQLDATGAVTSFDPNASSTVNALAVAGGRVYAGGTFTSIGGATHNRIAALDAATGLAVAGFNPNASNTVIALAVAGGTVYAGGGFTSIGGLPRANLVALNAVTGVPLPVELSAFTATAAGPTAVRLAWATASEKNSARFEVERSADGRDFERIGTVAAAGSSSSARSYALLDARLPTEAALLYYRLRLVDLDGTFSYSPVRTIQLPNSPTHQLTLFPNPAGHGPAHGAATLTGALPGAVVTVYDALGRAVTSATADATGTAALALPAGLPAGVYVVRAGGKALRLTVE